MKCKTVALLMLAMSMAAFAAQKPCSEVFPNEANVKTSLGLDGSRCTVSRVTNPKGKVVVRVKVSKDNSRFVYAMEQEWRGIAIWECEDVGAGKIYECGGSVSEKDGKIENLKRENFPTEVLELLFSGLSSADKYYLFGGLPPWEE